MTASEMAERGAGVFQGRTEKMLHTSRLAVATLLLLSHVVMIATMRLLLATYEPDPNGFRLDDLQEVFWWTILTLPPIAIASAAPSRASLAVAAVAHAASPLTLLPIMQTPGDDLNFAIFVWWGYLPVLMIAAFALEAWWRNRRAAD